jgi:hypothetical protein
VDDTVSVFHVYYLFVTVVIPVEVEDSGKTIINNKQTRIFKDSFLFCVKVH